MGFANRLIAGFCLATALVWPGLASAHLLPAQTATLNIVGNSAYGVISVPASALKGVDDNHDGLASSPEIRAHTNDISRQFQDRFRLSTAREVGQPLFTWVMNPDTEGASPAGSAYVVIMQRTAFTGPITGLTLWTDLFGTRPGEGQMTLRALHNQAGAEVAILSPQDQTHRFFRGPWATFLDFIKTGALHIWLGPDHLLFLLTVIVGAAGWRWWASVITSFTLAHSLTLTLAALGLVTLPARFVEPAIAASIVLMAADNLWRPGRKGVSRVAIVFACGLLHGLGFASALGSFGLDTPHRIASLVGFNLGVEFGQMVFLTALLALAAAATRLIGPSAQTHLPKAASILALLAGTAMLISRLVPGLAGL